MKRLLLAGLAAATTPCEAAVRYSLTGVHFNQPAALEFVLPEFASQSIPNLFNNELITCLFKSYDYFDIPCAYVNIGVFPLIDRLAVHNYYGLVPASYTFAAGSFSTLGVHESSNLNGDRGTLTVSLVASAVPEPTTWALFILGMAATGLALRRRQSTRVQFRFELMGWMPPLSGIV